MQYDNDENKNYHKIIYENNDYKNNNNFISINNNYEDSNYRFNNNQSQNIPLKEQKNKNEPLLIQNYQLMSSYPNNKINNLDEYYYSYTPSTNQKKDDLIISNNQFNQTNNNTEKKILSNILISPNNKNISLNSQISQEIDRQKLKFDEMVEKAKNLNNSENFHFDLKKYLPKENSFENSKALMKYKDLIKPKNLNKNNCISTRNNYENKFKNEKYEDIKNNSISEIPIKNEILFEEELSKSDFNFNIDSPIKNQINKENNTNTNNKINNQEIQNNLKQNLLNYNLNVVNLPNKSTNNNDILFKNDLNENDEHIKSNLKETVNLNDNQNSTKAPFFNVYFQKITESNDESISDNESNKNNLNEIEKTNLELLKESDYKNKNIYDVSWYCLDFDDNKEKIFEYFFNND